MRKLRQELQKVQELSRAEEEELRRYESRYSELTSKLTQTTDKHRQGLQEVAMREEQIVVLKVEVASLQEKLRHRTEEVCSTSLEAEEHFMCFIENYSGILLRISRWYIIVIDYEKGHIYIPLRIKRVIFTLRTSRWYPYWDVDQEA